MSQPWLAFYGDDFTGSTDAMEVLQWAGLRTVLFLDPPTPAQLARFDGLRAFGVAGSSRTMTPDEMEAELVSVFASLRDSGAPIVHYKTCSTFDSSSRIGSIGKAMELGRQVHGGKLIPLVIGAPNLGRYQCFGNLFARSGLDTEPFRLDRHPTMSRHPITPMDEADVRVHLASQTRLRLDLVDVLELDAADLNTPLLSAQADDVEAILFDALYPEHMPRIGAAIQAIADQDAPIFVVGSSGVEYALTAAWRARGDLDERKPAAGSRPKFGGADQLLVVTGSCSPVNARQIEWAEQHGFETIALNPARLIADQTSAAEIESFADRAVEPLAQGKHVLLHTSRGPDDERIAATIDALRSSGLDDLAVKLNSGRALGPKLGKIIRAVLSKHPLPRVGVAGGDTSGYIARELGIWALEAVAPVAPGSPLCRAYASNAFDGVEFFFKGGQVGKDNVWGTMVAPN